MIIRFILGFEHSAEYIACGKQTVVINYNNTILPVWNSIRYIIFITVFSGQI